LSHLPSLTSTTNPLSSIHSIGPVVVSNTTSHRNPKQFQILSLDSITQIPNRICTGWVILIRPQSLRFQQLAQIMCHLNHTYWEHGDRIIKVVAGRQDLPPIQKISLC
jgi:hypothetical protein